MVDSGRSGTDPLQTGARLPWRSVPQAPEMRSLPEHRRCPGPSASLALLLEVILDDPVPHYLRPRTPHNLGRSNLGCAHFV